MDLYVFADPPISAGFRNRLRLAMILPIDSNAYEI